MGALHVTVEHRHLGRQCRETMTVDSDKPHIVLYCLERSISKSITVLPQIWKIHC